MDHSVTFYVAFCGSELVLTFYLSMQSLDSFSFRGWVVCLFLQNLFEKWQCRKKLIREMGKECPTRGLLHGMAMHGH